MMMCGTVSPAVCGIRNKRRKTGSGFLGRNQQDLDEVRGLIISRIPLPSIWEVCQNFINASRF